MPLTARFEGSTNPSHTIHTFRALRQVFLHLNRATARESILEVSGGFLRGNILTLFTFAAKCNWNLLGAGSI
jgi:hypothetical protein